jgi:hypothetical protein
MTEPLRKYGSPAARRGRQWYIQIRIALNEMRRDGREPVAVWVLPATANDMRALWAEVGAFDGKLPLGVAGVPMKEGATGGRDFVFEYYDTRADEARARELMDPIFHVRDNPLAGTH